MDSCQPNVTGDWYDTAISKPGILRASIEAAIDYMVGYLTGFGKYMLETI